MLMGGVMMGENGEGAGKVTVLNGLVRALMRNET